MPLDVLGPFLQAFEIGSAIGQAFRRGRGGGNLVLRQPAPIVPIGPPCRSPTIRDRDVIPIAPRGVWAGDPPPVLAPGRMQAYDPATGRTVVVAACPPPKTAAQAPPPSAPPPIRQPVGQIVTYGGRLYQPVIPDRPLPPDRIAALDVETGKRAVLPKRVLEGGPKAEIPPPKIDVILPPPTGQTGTCRCETLCPPPIVNVQVAPPPPPDVVVRPVFFDPDPFVTEMPPRRAIPRAKAPGGRIWGPGAAAGGGAVVGGAEPMEPRDWLRELKKGRAELPAPPELAPDAMPQAQPQRLLERLVEGRDCIPICPPPKDERMQELARRPRRPRCILKLPKECDPCRSSQGSRTGQADPLAGADACKRAARVLRACGPPGRAERQPRESDGRAPRQPERREGSAEPRRRKSPGGAASPSSTEGKGRAAGRTAGRAAPGGKPLKRPPAARGGLGGLGRALRKAAGGR